MTGLSFDRYNPSRIFSSGRDGFVRLLDFRSEVFEEVLFQLNVLGNVTNFFSFIDSQYFRNVQSCISHLSHSERFIFANCGPRLVEHP